MTHGAGEEPVVGSHIIIDFSNVIYGSPDKTRDISIPGLINTLEAGQNFESKWIASSKKDATETHHETQFKTYGYRTKFEITQSKEHFVDAWLVAQGLKILSSATKPGTVTIATGDGNDKDGEASIFNMVEAFVRKGWHVILWSWRKGLSSKYRQLAKHFPSKIGQGIVINFFDDVIDQIHIGIGAAVIPKSHATVKQKTQKRKKKIQTKKNIQIQTKKKMQFLHVFGP